MLALHKWNVGAILMAFLSFFPGMNDSMAYGFLTKEVTRRIDRINDEGPFLGIVIPNAFEMSPLLKSPSFLPDQKLPYLDLFGKRFRFGRVEDKKVILVLTGLSMVNAGVTTQLLLTLFKIKGVLHHGIAGNANPNFGIGDVTIPQYWAHTGLWVWQRYGDGGDDVLPYESGGDFTRRIGVLNISENNVGTDKSNLLNNVWLQDEEIFPVNGIPEQRQRAFWVPVDKQYYKISEKLKDMKLENCVNMTTCLPRKPVVARVERGVTASVYVDNKAYRQFLYSKLRATPVDMETAAVALICYQQRTPFIAIRSLSDLAGGGSAISNEASIFSGLAAQNAVNVLVKFIRLLES